MQANSGQKTGMPRFERQVLARVILMYIAITPAILEAAVDLKWQPTQALLVLGETAEISLYAVSDSPEDQNVSALQVILTWDPLHLELLGNIDPCGSDPCPPNTYNWLSSRFPVDSNGDDNSQRK